MLRPRINRIHLDFISYVLLLLIIAQLIVSFWAINKGFDFTDEAYSYLGFENPEEINHVATYYTLLITNLFGWISLDIIHVRILKVVIQVLSSLLFSYGLVKSVKSFPAFSDINPFHLHLASLAGTLLYNTTGSQMLTYDVFSVSLLQIGAGLFFIILHNDSERTKLVGYLQSVAMGAVIFALFMVKYPNAILFIGIFSVFMLIKKTMKELLSFCLFSIGGFILFGFLIFKNNLVSWAYAYITRLKTATDTTINSILDNYVWDIKDTGSTLFFQNKEVFIVALALLLVVYLIPKNKIQIIAICVFGTLLIVFSIYNEYYLGGKAHRYTYSFLYIFIVALFVLALFVLAVLKKFKYLRQKQYYLLILALLFLLSAPFVGAIGTDNYLRMKIIMYMSFWFAFIYLISYWKSKLLALILLFIVSANAAYQDIYGLVYSPYRIYTPLTMQNQSLSFGSERVKLDDEKKREVEEVYSLIHAKTNFAPGMPIFSYRSEYGFIYFLQGTLPGWCWYKDKFQNFYCDCLKNSKIKDFEKMILILPKDHKMDSTFVAAFNSLGVAYPDHYRELGQVETHFEGELRNIVILAPENILK